MANPLSSLQSWKARDVKPYTSQQSPDMFSPSHRPCSMLASPPPSGSSSPGMNAQPNIIPHMAGQSLQKGNEVHRRGESKGSATFAPRFIGSLDKKQGQDADSVTGLEGENDFSGKRYVWVKDPNVAFVKGWVEQELEDDRLSVRCEDGSLREVESHAVDKVNPGKYDKVDDMAELTHLNEASVVHNLQMRYQSDLIYTYSGLFLVTVNPYCSLPIYNNDYINMFRGRSRDETKPHIFAMADEAYQKLIDEGTNQSILVTGESGAGKTENTKKVIQYLAAVASDESNSPNTRPPSRHSTHSRASSRGRITSNLSQQILQANPILEAFGNAQTMRNNNSSRFGKFIRIEFSESGQIAGAFIDWYLLEKSRVVKVNAGERNYHIFYQLLKGAPRRLKQELQLHEVGISHYAYLRDGNDNIGGVSDADEWQMLMDSLNIMGFSQTEQVAVFRTVAAILHLGNISMVKESLRADQAALAKNARIHIESACRLLGIQADSFIQSLLHPKVRAGREVVEKVQTVEQAKSSLDALAKNIYERAFGDLVSRINRQLDQRGMESGDHSFIGVLDIAGFEIFQDNSFEQLCINYTNEKLQQFFNHHMFVLEQEEYAREKIQWNFIDFGKDLQPTIDLIELSNPIGILSCLDEDSVMPKATDVSFTDKLHHLWAQKTNKYRASKLTQGFVLTHYAAEVEYSTDGWLQKNKDPQNENLTALLAASADSHIAELFRDCAEIDDSMSSKSRVKRGLFRTVAQKHKEQLGSLMTQLHATQPHFVRCILPNHKKRPKQFSNPLVLDQLRCNGVLEGIRIARTGFPNRLPFAEFRSRYEVLCEDFPRNIVDGQRSVQLIISKLKLDPAVYRVGLTKVFFRAGVLAELEEQRDRLIQSIMMRFQAHARGFTRRKAAYKLLYRAEAVNVIEESLVAYLKLQQNPWWSLFNHMRPLLGQTRTDAEVRQRDGKIKELQLKMQSESLEKQKVEEEKKRVETEMQRVHKTLESERALALDKEEIFKRLQQREVELSEKLTDAIQDQEDLEDQMDELMEAKKKSEAEANQWRTELENAGLLVAKLTNEKKELSVRHDQLHEQLQDNERSRKAKQRQHDDLSREIKMLTSQLSLKDRKLQELEHSQATADRDLERKHAEATAELQTSKRQIRELLDENRQSRQQMSELSASSADFENLIRRKESELGQVKNDLRKLQADGQAFESERASLISRHDQIQAQLRQLRSEVETLKAQKAAVDRELQETKQLLDAHISEDEVKRELERHVQDLTRQLLEVQQELQQEQQHRDDAETISNQRYDELKRQYDHLNENKILIEKELYSTQDSLRLSSDSKASTDGERRKIQDELRKLRQRFIETEQKRLEAEAAVEQNAVKQTSEKNMALQRELNDLMVQLDSSEHERKKLVTETQRLSKTIADSDSYRISKDQRKDHLEREVVTLKGRLTASENDNRALLNKIQQKNLDLSRSASKAGENQRTRISALTAEKQRAEEETRKLTRRLHEAQLLIAQVEKQKEKLALDLEDASHEMARERKSSRAVEKSNSQLSEVSRSLETERQLRFQAQALTRGLQTSLEDRERQLDSAQQQLLTLQKVFDPSISTPQDWSSRAPAQVSQTANLASQLQETERALQAALSRAANAESKLTTSRQIHEDELRANDSKHTSSKRAIFEELNANTIHNTPRSSPRKLPHPGFENQRPMSAAMNTPVHKRHHSSIDELAHTQPDSAKSDRTVDTVGWRERMDGMAELEQLQTQLQLSQLQNKHLTSQIEALRNDQRSASPSVNEDTRRVLKLEKENSRLHGLLDTSAKKLSSLEKQLQTDSLTLADVRAQSHEQLFDLLTTQESARKSLARHQASLVDELTDAKRAFDTVKASAHDSAAEVSDLRQQLSGAHQSLEAESRNAADLQNEVLGLSGEVEEAATAASDARQSASLYKARADEYFARLEEAEVKLLKSTRNESFLKTQALEAEAHNDGWSAEKQRLEEQVEDLSRDSHMFAEKLEDLSTELQAETAKSRRLANELEDAARQRAMEAEEREAALASTRRKYNAELAALAADLTLEQEAVLAVRQANGRLQEEIEDLRGKWDDEMLNSSTWAKEKLRLQGVLEDVAASRDEAVSAHNDAQGRIVTLVGQIRSLRSENEELGLKREELWKEKRTLEARLSDTSRKLEELAAGSDVDDELLPPSTIDADGKSVTSHSPSRSTIKDRAGLEKQILDLRSALASKEDITAAAIGKMRRAEALAAETARDVSVEREENVKLHGRRAELEREVKELRARCVDLETASTSPSREMRNLNAKIRELEAQLQAGDETSRSASRIANREESRAVSEIRAQLARKQRAEEQLSAEVARWQGKCEKLLKEVEALETARSEDSVKTRRVEREVREEREERQRVERELEGWKGLRLEKPGGSLYGGSERAHSIRLGSRESGSLRAGQRPGSAASNYSTQRTGTVNSSVGGSTLFGSDVGLPMPGVPGEVGGMRKGSGLKNQVEVPVRRTSISKILI